MFLSSRSLWENTTGICKASSSWQISFNSVWSVERLGTSRRNLQQWLHVTEIAQSWLSKDTRLLKSWKHLAETCSGDYVLLRLCEAELMQAGNTIWKPATATVCRWDCAKLTFKTHRTSEKLEEPCGNLRQLLAVHANVFARMSFVQVVMILCFFFFF